MSTRCISGQRVRSAGMTVHRSHCHLDVAPSRHRHTLDRLLPHSALCARIARGFSRCLPIGPERADGWPPPSPVDRGDGTRGYRSGRPGSAPTRPAPRRAGVVVRGAGPTQTVVAGGAAVLDAPAPATRAARRRPPPRARDLVDLGRASLHPGTRLAPRPPCACRGWAWGARGGVGGPGSGLDQLTVRLGPSGGDPRPMRSLAS
jgi:hypothetical protein